MSDDILVELSNEEIDELQKFYKNSNRLDLVYAHLHLRNILQWNLKIAEMTDEEREQISYRCKTKFYRSKNGSDENKTFVGISHSPGDLNCILVVTLDESLKELRDCLEQTKLISWSERILFISLHERFKKMIYDVIEAKGARVQSDDLCSLLWMDKGNALTYDFTVPDGVELKPVRIEDSKVIDDVWFYKNPSTEPFIKSLIKLNASLGIYKDDELVSWILQVDSFGFGMLQTLEEHQGRGYARTLIRAMTRLISEKLNEDVILFASYGRPKTVDLYIRYGYKHAAYTHFIISGGN